MVYFPINHFIGSKESIWDWISNKIDTTVSYTSVLDLFGGSGFMSNAFRSTGKNVIYNDIMKAFQFANIGLLQSNVNHIIDITNIDYLWTNDNENNIHFVYDHYKNIYFFEDESKWIDIVISNILNSNESPNIQGIYFFALSQAVLRKRPFNTFHGSFLNLRLKERKNPQSWDKPLEVVFKETIKDVNDYLTTIPSSTNNIPIYKIEASKADHSAFSETPIDLLYLDPPFIAGKKRSRRFANYFINYHVLEALANYYSFSDWIDPLSELNFPKTNHPIMEELNNWITPEKFLISIEKVFSKFRDSIIALSYRNDSFVKHQDIIERLTSYKEKIVVYEQPHVYNIKNKKSKFNDILIIGK